MITTQMSDLLLLLYRNLPPSLPNVHNISRQEAYAVGHRKSPHAHPTATAFLCLAPLLQAPLICTPFGMSLFASEPTIGDHAIHCFGQSHPLMEAWAMSDPFSDAFGRVLNSVEESFNLRSIRHEQASSVTSDGIRLFFSTFPRAKMLLSRQIPKDLYHRVLNRRSRQADSRVNNPRLQTSTTMSQTFNLQHFHQC